MTKEYFFGDAKWVGASERSYDGFSTLYGVFNIKEDARAKLNVLGLGFFKCYINGVCINPDTFLPLSSEYEATSQPVGEVFAGNRIYVPCACRSVACRDVSPGPGSAKDIPFGASCSS